MANKYVRKGGSDANSGNDAAHAYLTIQKGLDNVSTGGGDTIFVGAGTYRELLKPTLTYTVQTTVLGDVDGYNTGDAGEVIVSAYTTNDTTAAASTDSTLDLNGKSFLTFQGLTFIGSGFANASCVIIPAASHDVQFRQVCFNPGGGIGQDLLRLTATVDVASNLLVDRCIFAPTNAWGINILAPRSSTADYDVGLTITNTDFKGCLKAIQFQSTGAGNFRPGGGYVNGCSFFAIGNTGVATLSNWSTDKPAVVLNANWLAGMDTATLSAGRAQNLWEDGNIINAAPSVSGGNIYTNMPLVGSITKSDLSRAPLLHLGQDLFWNALRPRRFGEPESGSPILGFSPFSDVAIKVGATAADDSTVGTISWTNPGNALSFLELAGEAYAVASAIPITTGVSHYLKISNFGFSVPSDATVLGFRVEVNRKASNASRCSWNLVKLSKDGTTLGTDLVSTASDGNAQWGTADGWVSFGSNTNLGGLTVAPADVNASTFSVFLSAKNTSGAGTVDASIDGVRLVVYYIRAKDSLPTDITGIVRPAGGQSENLAAGAYEYQNAAIKETSTVQAGSAAGKLIGPGSYTFPVPVKNSATTFSLYLRYDSPYAGSRPQVSILQGATAGAAQTVTATTSANGAWEQQTFSGITPAANGVIWIRILSRDTNGAGIVRFDTLGAS